MYLCPCVCVYTSTDVFTLSHLNFKKNIVWADSQLSHCQSESDNASPAFCISAVTVLIFPEATGYFCLMRGDSHGQKGSDAY